MISYGNKIEKSFETLFSFISNITKYLQKGNSSKIQQQQKICGQ